jgi:hypothetical protein
MKTICAAAVAMASIVSLAGCSVTTYEPPRPAATTYVAPAPTATYVTPAAPSSTTVIRTP